MKINTFTFPNGFRVIYEKSTNNFPVASIHLFCEFGSIHEREGSRGIAHFIEHMVFKGTKKIPTSKNIFIEYDKIGAYFNAFTEKQYTGYTIKCDNSHIENSLIILSDMIFNSTFNKKEFKKEEQVVIEENIKMNDDPEKILYENMDKLLYKENPYAYSIDNIEYHKKLFDYDKVIEMYKLFYNPNNMIVSIVSNISFENIKKIIQKTFFSKPFIQKQLINKPNINEGNINCFLSNEGNIQYNIQKKIGIETTHVCIGFKVNSNDKYLLELLKTILNGPMSSRLFMTLREENGLTYSSTITTTFFKDIGSFIIYTETNNKKIIKNGNKIGVLPLLIKILNDLIEKGVNINEINISKGYLKGSMIIDLENNNNNALYNGEEFLLNPDKKIIPLCDVFDTYYKNTTKTQLNTIIKTYFKKANMNVCFIGEHIPSLKEIQRECEKLKI
jgi:predicted Zn-dependent peptidase